MQYILVVRRVSLLFCWRGGLFVVVVCGVVLFVFFVVCLFCFVEVICVCLMVWGFFLLFFGVVFFFFFFFVGFLGEGMGVGYVLFRFSFVVVVSHQSHMR